HDLIACPLSDPREAELPESGLQEILDPESGALFLLDTAPRQLRQAFRQRAATEAQELQRQFRKLRIDSISLSTNKPFIDDVRRLFQIRQRRAARG
ncbi:MAG: DUF58 domain-containing protein, partial [Lentisphaerae bacterium]|nr:DUF58 domain-containing protein [Lentisphaerota bacterium]